MGEGLWEGMTWRGGSVSRRFHQNIQVCLQQLGPPLPLPKYTLHSRDAEGLLTTQENAQNASSRWSFEHPSGVVIVLECTDHSVAKHLPST